MPEPILDTDALNALTMGNAALQKEAFGIFFAESSTYRERFAAAAAAADQEAWRAAAHGLKGSALGLGLAQLGALCKTLEAGAPDAAALATLDDAVAKAEAAAALVIAQ